MKPERLTDEQIEAMLTNDYRRWRAWRQTAAYGLLAVSPRRTQVVACEDLHPHKFGTAIGPTPGSGTRAIGNWLSLIPCCPPLKHIQALQVLAYLQGKGGLSCKV